MRRSLRLDSSCRRFARKVCLNGLVAEPVLSSLSAGFASPDSFREACAMLKFRAPERRAQVDAGHISEPAFDSME
jgi:hypothetical protein